jgi:hypothetical protein
MGCRRAGTGVHRPRRGHLPPQPSAGMASVVDWPCRGRPAFLRWAGLVPTFSAADTAVAPAPTAKLVTSAVETTGDCSTGASHALFPNASWPEAFLPLSDVAWAALCTNNDLDQNGSTLSSRCKTRQKKRSHDLLGCRPKVGLAGLWRSLPHPLVQPKVAHYISARPGALFSC